MADEATGVEGVASALRGLAARLVAMLDDAADAAGEYTWIGPAADRYRYELCGRRAELDQVTTDLSRVATCLEERAEELRLLAAARDQRIHLMGAG